MAGLDDLVTVQGLSMGLAEGAHSTEEVMEAMCAAIGRIRMTCIDVAYEQRSSKLGGYVRVDPELMAIVERDYITAETNPAIEALPRMALRSLDHFERYDTWEHIRSMPVYADFWIPSRVGHAGTALYPIAGGGALLFSIGCDLGANYLDRDETRWLTAALDAFTRGAALRMAVDDARALEDLTADVSASCMMLLDWDGRVLKASATAEAVLASVNCILLRADRVEASTDALRVQLDAAIASARHGGSTILTALAPNGPVRIEVSQGPSYRRQASILLVVRSPHPPRWDRTTLRQAFALTPREADVALKLIEGLSAAEIADARGLATSSVRLYIKRILAKTDTHSQAQLVSSLLAP